MIELKIGRKVYQITPKDKFLDNGSCVQLMTQKASFLADAPVLSKRAVKELKSVPYTTTADKGRYGQCDIIRIL